jgi:hypothetical protein
LISSKLENLEEVDKFLDVFNQPKLNQGEISHLNRSIISIGIEAVTKSFPTRSQGPDGFMVEFNQTFKELIPILLKLFQKIERKRILPKVFYEASVTLIPKPNNDATATKRIKDQYL